MSAAVFAAAWFAALVFGIVVYGLRVPRAIMYEEKKKTLFFREPQSTGRLLIKEYYFEFLRSGGIFLRRVTINKERTTKAYYLHTRKRQYKFLFKTISISK